MTKVANSPRMLVACALTILFVSSSAYHLAERKGLADSLWWAVVTASTVGYGDAYPRTGEGRIVASVLVVSMVLFFIPMVTASFASKLIVNRDAFTHEEQEQIKEGLIRLLELAGDHETAARIERDPGSV